MTEAVYFGSRCDTKATVLVMSPLPRVCFDQFWGPRFHTVRTPRLRSHVPFTGYVHHWDLQSHGQGRPEVLSLDDAAGVCTAVAARLYHARSAWYCRDREALVAANGLMMAGTLRMH